MSVRACVVKIRNKNSTKAGKIWENIREDYVWILGRYLNKIKQEI
jgi:hypothetical protein